MVPNDPPSKYQSRVTTLHDNDAMVVGRTLCIDYNTMLSTIYIICRAVKGTMQLWCELKLNFPVNVLVHYHVKVCRYLAMSCAITEQSMHCVTMLWHAQKHVFKNVVENVSSQIIVHLAHFSLLMVAASHWTKLKQIVETRIQCQLLERDNRPSRNVHLLFVFAMQTDVVGFHSHVKFKRLKHAEYEARERKFSYLVCLLVCLFRQLVENFAPNIFEVVKFAGSNQFVW